MSFEPIRIPHGQLEGKDVADMSYGVKHDDRVRGFDNGEIGRGERTRGGCMRFEVVLHAYRRLR